VTATREYEAIGYAIADGILVITLDNPERWNAYGPVMEREMRAALEAGDADPSVRVIVLTGAGSAFCVGADMTVLEQIGDEIPLPAAPTEAAIDHFEGNYQRRFTYMLRIGTPVIAAINGPAAGVGVSFALYCDFRFMVETAKLSTSFSRRGLIAEHGTSWMLSRLIGPMNALDLLMTGRKITGREAGEMGLVRARPAETFAADVRAFALDITANVSPRSTRVMKRQVYDALMQSLGDACLAAESEEVKSFSSNDFTEGVAHFVEKRAPHFTGT
jgi:enoyl-CoA hydratase/carnithine racemase